MKRYLHIGIDDTDSPRGGCTTYIAALLVEKLAGLGVEFVDYPNLVRLNPNVPWKTRGNGAVCLRLSCEQGRVDKIRDLTLDLVENESDSTYPRTDPAVVFYDKNAIPKRLKQFSKKAEQDIVGLDEAISLLSELRIEAVGFKEGAGIVGALAAVGEDLCGDNTYEFICYRIPTNWGLPRRIDRQSVFSMDAAMRDVTFNNLDERKNRVLITPRGPDPVLFGIRGETPDSVIKAALFVKPEEEVERWVVFRTNQGTDAHLKRVLSVREVKPFQPVIVRGLVSKPPMDVVRRHVVFGIADENGGIDCAAYEPTGEFRAVVRKIVRGDQVEAYGGVRAPSEDRPPTINLEKLLVARLVEIHRESNPLCPDCGRRMSSMGKESGFRCDHCGRRERNRKKIRVMVERDIREGLYVTPPRANRHLTKPLIRYGREKSLSGIPKPYVFWGRNLDEITNLEGMP